MKKTKDELTKELALKDLFIDILRHDMLNSIGVIKNVAELLEEEVSSPEIREKIEMIKKNASKLEEIINQASMCVELADQKKLEFEIRNISPIIERVLEHFEFQSREKNILLENRIKGEYVACISPLIENVFLNLISNAIKYSPGNSKITVEAEDLGEKIRIIVKDQGVGIKDEYKERIFYRFITGEKKGIKGTGLGLTIVKRIVDLHGGRVWVEDNPGGGSIFYVELPKG